MRTILFAFFCACSLFGESSFSNGSVSGTSILARNIVVEHRFYRTPNSSLNISGDENNPVFKVSILKKHDNFFSVQLLFPVKVSLQKKDLLLISFQARSLSSENNSPGLFQVYFQKNTKNWHKCLSEVVRTDKSWRTYYYPLKLDRNFAEDQSELCFGFGLNKQVVEIKNIKFLRYEKGVNLNDLPKNDIPISLYAYEGMSLDSAWRKAAAERIDRIRKANISVRVTRRGERVKGAKVAVKMKRHAFLFGSAIKMALLRENSENAGIFRKKFLELFNSGAPENSLKWPPVAGDWGRGWTFENTRKSLDWLKKHNIKTRGHVLLWPSWKHTPKFLGKYKNNPRKLKEAIDRHIVDLSRKCEPFLYEWDVVNEPFTNNDLMKVLGDDIMSEWFATARKSVPNTVLYLNDYNILTKPHGRHYAYVKKLVAKLIAAGAPIGGLGLQSHFGATLTPPVEVLKTLDDLSKYKLKLKITEFDVDSEHRQLIANYTRDFMTAIFSHPSIHGFQMWGFWAGAHWRPRAAMYDRNWTERPNLKAYKQLVFKDWWSDVAGKTDANGLFLTRAFLGDYEITVKLGDKVRTIKKTLGKSSLEVYVDF